jgi:hypothetical protein
MSQPLCNIVTDFMGVIKFKKIGSLDDEISPRYIEANLSSAHAVMYDAMLFAHVLT